MTTLSSGGEHRRAAIALYAARHPGPFRGAASFSGLLHAQPDPRFMLGLFESETPEPTDIWGDPQRDRETWASHDPTALAPRLRGTKLFVSPGPLQLDTLNEATVLRESRAFVARVKQAGLRVRTDFYGAGNHDWPYWQRELCRSLPTVLAS
jgi:diacylglycerol O-acyltransferase / trehalose O-mycolyltransferase